MADTHERADLTLRTRPPGSARILFPQLSPFLAEDRAKGEAAVAEPFVGITTSYRLHSPVILIEFDHQRGIVFANDRPSRHHIHTVVRTPNGNDYGKDLLRQHHAEFDHVRGGHRPAHASTPA